MEWERDYAPLNVRQELIHMHNWLTANPRRRKKNYQRFVVGWIKREYAKVAHAQVLARIGSRVGAYTGESKSAKANYSADDRAYYEKFWKEHPELKPSWWEDSDGKSEPMQKSLGIAG